MAHPPRSPGKHVILVADDDAAVRQLAADLLRSAGYQVVEAQDGSEALRHAREPSCSVDLLLTDIIMPGINGFELAAQIRRQRPEIRILFMSGYMEAMMSPGQISGDVLQKPFRVQSLLAAVKQAIGGRGDPSDPDRAAPRTGGAEAE